MRQFKECALDAVRRDTLQDFLDAKAATFSNSLVSKLRWDLKQIFTMAQAEGLTERNPAQLLSIPKVEKRPNRAVMMSAQIGACLAALNSREQLIVKFAVLAGMRPGEIFALRWGYVAETYVEVKQRVYEGVLDSPKSKRKVALSEGLAADLDRWRQTSNEFGGYGIRLSL